MYNSPRSRKSQIEPQTARTATAAAATQEGRASVRKCKRRSEIPVSYTHLDVYKRQVLQLYEIWALLLSWLVIGEATAGTALS